MTARDDDGYHERFERMFFSRVPPEVARSFTDAQISAIKGVFGGERWDGHAVDFRGVIPFPFRKHYFVFVAGRDRRARRRPRTQPTAGRVVRLVVGTAMSTVALIWLVLLVLYTVLPADILPKL